MTLLKGRAHTASTLMVVKLLRTPCSRRQHFSTEAKQQVDPCESSWRRANFNYNFLACAEPSAIVLCAACAEETLGFFKEGRHCCPSLFPSHTSLAHSTSHSFTPVPWRLIAVCAALATL